MKRLYRHIIFFLFSFIIFYHNAFAQIFPYRQYTTADELASSNVNDIMHDSRGYVWFATDRGVSRFDGFKFTNYLFKEGLPAAKIISFSLDQEGKIIAAAAYKGVSLFGNNFNELMPASELLACDQIAYTGNYLYSLKYAGYITVADLTSKKIKKISFGDSSIQPYAIITSGNNDVIAATDRGIYTITPAGKAEKKWAASDHTAVYSVYEKDGILYAGGDGVIYIPEKNLSYKTPVAGEVRNLLISSAGDYWYTSSSDNKLYLQKNDGNTVDLSTKLQIEGTQINKIFEDNEGNIWIATSGKGIFCIHHFYNTNYTKLDGLKKEYVTALEGDNNGNLFVGTSGGLFYLNDNHITYVEQTHSQNIQIQSLLYHNNNLYVTVNDNLNEYTDLIKNNIHNYQIIYSRATPVASIENRIRDIYEASGLGSQPGEENYDKFCSQLSGIAGINKIYKDPGHNIWIGTSKGLVTIYADNHIVAIDTGFFDASITSISPGGKNILYFGNEKGLVKLENEKWKFYSQLKGKNIASITSLATDSKNRLWIGTLAGLFMWDNFAIIQFDTKNVLLSDEINALIFDSKNNYMWAGSSFGLSCIDIDKFDNTPIFAPQSLFKNLRTADSFYRELDLHSDLVLHYKSSNFTLRFSAIHFSTPEGVKFLYKYDDADWQPAIGRQIEFASMPYGNHTFLIKAIGERDLEGPVASLRITVQTPFWATTWFKISAGILIAFLVYYIIRKRFETIKKKQQERLELQAKIAELRHQALVASMNPHFIFNALNSIQQFINVRETDEASEYLGKFARLIRIMLNSGGKTFILLSEELERLKYYLDLEQIRFGNKLTFHISVDEHIDTGQTEIPNMVIQPIVENALWHGLLPANKKGILNISFSKQNGSLKVVVDDNGIGINESRKRKKSGHISLGIQMIEERLSLLKKLNGYEATISVTDKSDLKTDSNGTLVEIHLS